MWLLAAATLWVIAAVIDRPTEVVIENLGDHLRFEVAGTEIAVSPGVRSVHRLTFWASDSIDPPILSRWTITEDGATRTLPRNRQPLRALSGASPVGDWWVDRRCEPRILGDHFVDLAGTFETRLLLHGRFTNEASLTLSGAPTLHFGFRRGFKDNYLVVRDDLGEVLDVTTIAPSPLADAGALAAQVLRSVAVACLVIAFVGAIVSAGSRSQAAPAPAGRRGARTPRPA